MTAKELAQRLNGREYCQEMTNEDRKLAMQSGLVVIYGCSDDLVEIDGAIRDEAGCYEGDTFRVTKDGVVYAPDCGDSECAYYKAAVKEAKMIEAVWNNAGNPCWTYKTDIPHETFNIYEDGELYCEGIVFRVEEL